MPEALWRHARIENRKVRGVEHAVADPHQRGDRIEPEDAGRKTREDRPAGDQAEPPQKHGTRAEAVDGEPGRELGQSAGKIERAGKGAQCRERNVEFRPQQREHRGQHQLEKVRRPMGEPDQPDDFHIVAERVGASGIQGGA